MSISCYCQQQTPPLCLTKSILKLWGYLEFIGNIIRTVSYWQCAISSMRTVKESCSYTPVGPWVCLLCFLLEWLSLCLCYVLFYYRQLSHFPSYIGTGVTNKWASFKFFVPCQLLRVSWLHPSKAHCEQEAMRDEGVIYVAGHPLMNRIMY